jgi:hypothetical protein
MISSSNGGFFMKSQVLALAATLAFVSFAHATSYSVHCTSSAATIDGTLQVDATKQDQASGTLQVVDANSVAQQLSFTGTVATQDNSFDKSALRTRVQAWTNPDAKPLYAFSVTQTLWADGSTQYSSLVAVDQQPYTATCTLTKN